MEGGNAPDRAAGGSAVRPGLNIANHSGINLQRQLPVARLLYLTAARIKTGEISRSRYSAICWYGHFFSPATYGTRKSSALRRLRPSAV